MIGLRHHPLGTVVGGSPHGVCCSLPTMADVIGYEENDPRVRGAMKGGYPRFVRNPLVRELTDWLVRKGSWGEGQCLFPVASENLAKSLMAFVGKAPLQEAAVGGFQCLGYRETSEEADRARAFCQHTGALISSRQAERFLAEKGVRAEIFAEERYVGDGEGYLKGVLSDAWSAETENLFLCNSGMNAVYSAFRAVSAVQADEGRQVWLRLGWLYVDTMEILAKMTGSADLCLAWGDVMDLDGLAKLLKIRGMEIAGILLEAPTNPLLETVDLPRLAELAEACGIMLVADPTLASPSNIDLLRYVDLGVNSLTKYVGAEGDVLGGCVVVNPNGRKAAALKGLLGDVVEPPFADDLARLAHESKSYGKVVSEVSRSARAVASFLENDERVESVFSPLKDPVGYGYARLSRHTPPRGGGVLSFTLRGNLADFFDNLQMAKGPSFGARFSIICPFMYLAHYDLVTTVCGRRRLKEAGISPELLRLSCGCEGSEAIVAALDEAL